MKKATSFRKIALIAMAAILLCLLLTACGGGGKSPSVEELKTYRELSWEGTELTVKLGTNKDTGCEWKNEFGDDSIIDYSINRKFTLSDKGAASGQAVGILSAGFEGKSEGTTTITFTTPCDWDGNGPGYTYIVTVEVAADGTIVSAVGEEAEAPPAGPAAASGLDEYAGEYTFICTRFSAAYMSDMLEYDGEAQDIPDQYVDMPERAGETVTLEADGTGYLYWGEDNQGPIDWWTVDGSALQFQAGAAVIEGTIIDGIMTVELDDGFWALFALPGADTSGIAPVSIDDYIDLLYGDGTETSPAEDMPLEGEYTLFAVQNDGYTVDSNEMEIYSTLTLNEGGTGSMTMDEDAMDIESWSAEDGMLTVVLTDGSSAQAVIGNGILELDIPGTGDMLLYYAQDGADISGYELMSVDEILAAYAADGE